MADPARDLGVDLSRYQLGWHDDVDYVFKPKRGLNADIVREMSWMKGEPDWMLAARLRALRHFERRPMPSWGGDLSGIDFNNIFYYIKPTAGQVDAWEDLPDAVKRTYDKLGIPEAERKYLAGVTAQYESEVVFHRNRADLEAQGVIFCDMDTALREYPELVKQYWGKVIPANDNKFSALNTSVWSGGSFIYVPPGVEVSMPLQAYFRINAENMGQFERTLIIADEGSKVHYIEGCLLEGERVELPDGSWRPAQDIAPNDLVVGHDGNPTRVVDVMKRDYAGNKHTIVPASSGNAFTVTSEHPILAVRRSDVRTARSQRKPEWKSEVSTERLIASKPVWLRADELQEGDFIVFPKRVPVPDTPDLGLDFMRLAGYFLAEGHCAIVNKCKALIFSFHLDEKDYIEEVRQLTHALWGKRGSVYEDPSKHEARVTVYTAEGYDLMLRHTGTGSSAKAVSSEVFNQQEDHVSALVDAYVNGDGNRVDTGRGEWIRCHTVSQDWAFQLQALIARSGIFATLRLERPAGPGNILGRKVRRQDLWIVQWRTNKKISEVRDAGDYFLVPVREIRTDEFEGPVFNFETESVHSYLVKGFATHNCSAPVYTTDSLHSAVVEIIVKPSARVTYTTIQNWSNNVYNLVTKRARVEAEGHMEWTDGNIGSLLTMKYPAVYLMGPQASGEVLSVAYAGAGQHQDAGAKMVHAAPETTSRIVSKSIAKDGGRTSYRGLVRVEDHARGCRSHVQCDALILDDRSVSDTFPYMEVGTRDAVIGHEATVSKVADDQLFYLMSRGLAEEQAMGMIVNGFIEPVTRTLPMEYAVEWSRLIELQMDGSVG